MTEAAVAAVKPSAVKPFKFFFFLLVVFFKPPFAEKTQIEDEVVGS